MRSTVSLAVGCNRPHPPSPFIIIISQPESWHSLYRLMEGWRRINESMHCLYNPFVYWKKTHPWTSWDGAQNCTKMHCLSLSSEKEKCHGEGRADQKINHLMCLVLLRCCILRAGLRLLSSCGVNVLKYVEQIGRPNAARGRNWRWFIIKFDRLSLPRDIFFLFFRSWNQTVYFGAVLCTVSTRSWMCFFQ